MNTVTMEALKNTLTKLSEAKRTELVEVIPTKSVKSLLKLLEEEKSIAIVTKNSDVVQVKVKRTTIELKALENPIKVKKQRVRRWCKELFPTITGYLIMTTKCGIISHHEVLRKGLGGEIIGFVEDVTNENRQNSIISTEHDRAHRGTNEVESQIRRSYFSPNMAKLIKIYTNSCPHCNKHKYERKPYNIKITSRPITDKPFERIHMDIFIIANRSFLSLIVSFLNISR